MNTCPMIRRLLPLGVVVLTFACGEHDAFLMEGGDDPLGALDAKLQTEAGPGFGTILEKGPLAQGATVTGALAKTEQHHYTLQRTGDAPLRLTLKSNGPGLDPYLYVRSPSGRVYENDDANGTLDAALEILAPEAGLYDVWATSYRLGGTGAYALAASGPLLEGVSVAGSVESCVTTATCRCEVTVRLRSDWGNSSAKYLRVVNASSGTVISASPLAASEGATIRRVGEGGSSDPTEALHGRCFAGDVLVTSVLDASGQLLERATLVVAGTDVTAPSSRWKLAASGTSTTVVRVTGVTEPGATVRVSSSNGALAFGMATLVDKEVGSFALDIEAPNGTTLSMSVTDASGQSSGNASIQISRNAGVVWNPANAEPSVTPTAGTGGCWVKAVATPGELVVLENASTGETVPSALAEVASYASRVSAWRPGCLPGDVVRLRASNRTGTGQWLASGRAPSDAVNRDTRPPLAPGGVSVTRESATVVVVRAGAEPFGSLVVKHLASGLDTTGAAQPVGVASVRLSSLAGDKLEVWVVDAAGNRSVSVKAE